MREITIRVPDLSPRNVLLFLVLAGGMAFTWYYASRTQEPQHVHQESESGPGDKVLLTPEARSNAQIQTLDVHPRPLQEWLEAAGVVEPDLNHVVRIRPLARGVVRGVYARAGDQVRPNQVLFDYDNLELGELLGEYRTLLSQRGKLEARAKVAAQAAERAQSLVAAQALAAKELELRVAEEREAQADLEAQQAGINAVLRKLRRFGLDLDQLNAIPSEGPTLARVRAPQAGVVLDFKVAPGEVVSSDQEVMTLANLERVWVIASVYEKDLGRVKTGQQAEISFASFPNRRWSGRISQLGAKLDPETRTGLVRVEVHNPGQSLKLEMFAAVRLPTQDPRVVPAVPETSLQQIEGKNAVFIQTGANEFQKREVELGHKSGEWVEITRGLNAGEQVVTQGSFYLKSTLLKETLAEEH
jgi:cobalt-zinc-cadmium efflux system membrane fusion protein